MPFIGGDVEEAGRHGVCGRCAWCGCKGRRRGAGAAAPGKGMGTLIGGMGKGMGERMGCGAWA